MNKIFIIGNLTRQPELRTTQDGTPVCGFTVAVNRNKSRSNPDPDPDFFHVTAWRGLGETCAKYLDKGRKVAITGRVSLHTWENTDGRHGASLEVMAEDIEFLTARAGSASPADAPADPSGMQEVEPDDLPF